MEINIKKRSITVLGSPQAGKSTILEKLEKHLGNKEFKFCDPTGMDRHDSIPDSLYRSEIIIIIFDMSLTKINYTSILKTYYKIQEYDNKIILLGNKRDACRLSQSDLTKVKILINPNFYEEISAKNEDFNFFNVIEFIKQDKEMLDRQHERVKFIKVKEKTYQYCLCGGDCGIPGDIYSEKYVKAQK